MEVGLEAEAETEQETETPEADVRTKETEQLKRLIGIQDTTLATGAPGNDNDLYGLYTQAGYFFNEIWSGFPEPLELAARYAWLREPNENDLAQENERQEFTVAANWFFNGHNNKLTLDYSYLTLEDEVLDANKSGSRVRLQWDISF